MTSLRVWMTRLMATVTASWRRARRLDEEVSTHLALLQEQFEARGMTAREAEQAARRAFGNVDRIRMEHREQRGLPVVATLADDAVSALRTISRDRWFSLGIVLVLALGLAVNTAIFTIVNGMTWRSLPVPDGSRIVHISSRNLQGRNEGMYTSAADIEDWRSTAKSFSGLGAYATAAMNVGDATRPADRLAGVYVSANTFDVLRVQPNLGRAFVTEDDRPDANAVALLAYHIWTSRFGADPSIVGRPVRINGAPVTVIGVMPPNFEFPLRADIWQPLALMPGFDPIDRNARRVDGVARLGDGVTLEEASVEMQGIAAAVAARHPQTNQHIGVRTVPFTHAFVAAPPEAREPLIMMIGAALVLLIACANGAGLLLARANRRAREMAMRATLGASRRRIIRHLLFEALLMSAAAAVLGVALSMFAVRLFAREVTDLNLPFWIAFEFDARVFVYVAVACLGAAIASGLVPALQLARSDPQDILKDGGRGIIGGRKGQRWSSAMLVSELAVTFILLSAGGLLLRSSATLSDDDARLALDRVFTARVAVPASQYASLEQRQAWHRTLHEQLGVLPAISVATLSSARPFMDATSWELRLDGTAVSDRLPVVQAIGVDHRYFETLQLPLLQGRPLTAGDARPGHLAVVVNQRFVHTHFSGESPLGRRIQLAEAGRTPTPQIAWFTVVGVAPDVRQRPLSRPAPLVYMPLDAHMWSTLALTYRGVADAEATDLVREAVRAVDPDTAVFNVSSLRRLSENSRWTATFVSLVISVFAAIALALSAAGLYGITAYGLAQRTAEIGLRVAIGAGKRHVVWTLLRRTVLAAGIAMAVGAAGAWSVGQIIRAALVQSAAPDFVLLLRVFGIVMVVITAACAVPVWRALHLHPIDALRHE